MTKITMNIECDSAVELQNAVLHLADFCSLRPQESVCGCQVKIETATAVEPDPVPAPIVETPKRSPTRKDKTEVKAAPIVETAPVIATPEPEIQEEQSTESEQTAVPEPELAKEPAPAPQDTPAKVSEKAEDSKERIALRLKFSELVGKGMQKQVIELLTSVNAAKVSGVPESEIAGLLAKAEAILNA